MKKVLKGLLAAALLSSSAFAATSNHTYFADRAELNHAGMMWAVNNHHGATAGDDSVGAFVSATGFYRQSNNPKEIGKFFGNGADSIVVAKGASNVDELISNYTKLHGYAVDHAPSSKNSLVSAGEDHSMSGTLNLKPEQTTYGAHIMWNQDLGSLVDGLSFSVSAPIVNVANNMNASVTSAAASEVLAADGGAGQRINEYFDGTMSKTIATPAANVNVTQAALAKGKIMQGSKSHDQTGVADVDVRLNWNFLNGNRYSLGAGLSVVIPTGNSSTGEFLYEPVYGNNGHVAVGGSLSGEYRFNPKGNAHCKLNLMVDYKYVLEATEKRIAGIYDKTKAVLLPSGQYRNVMADAVLGVQPAANVLLQDMTVEPGHQIEGLLGCGVEWKQWNFDFGYNLFWAEQERNVKAKAWADDTYAVANHKYSMDTTSLGDHAHKIGGVEPVSVGGPLQNPGTKKSALFIRVAGTPETAGTTKQTSRYCVDVDNSARNPQRLTHTLVGGFGYKVQGDYPVVLGLGGSYDFAGNNHNSQHECWSVWAKLGMNF